MLAPLNNLYESFSSFTFSFNNSALSSTIQRIREIVSRTLERTFSFIDSYDVYSNDISLKTFAFIGCLSLVALIVISLLRKKEGGFPPLLTPSRESSETFNRQDSNASLNDGRATPPPFAAIFRSTSFGRSISPPPK